ncbi:septum formation inhibitor Maf [Aequorivita xiaoshiensis]|uniref:Septum formation inhibitor Maf n=1 Tax=Aequorivita xiaoshiensis TaxID=2874476 RepID=A0A9X1R5V4_9FLAO|nr:septum formation inhibitor Maf [Aequorivita xiaoshiensis]MCG2431574.1 septum formation inhibitor Maf [Aequorivita xiaoshiensis]
MYLFRLFALLFLSLFLFSCNSSEEKKEFSKNTNETIKENDVAYRNVSQEFEDYWYSGKAEITSYDLSQERYSEIRKGKTVNIFVSENFLPKEQVKADNDAKENISVLKLNQTKNFNTGIYPYSVMTSTFSPISTRENAIKISTSVQEWCGQIYMQLNNRNNYEIRSHSYFADEGDKNFSLPKTWLENELWNLIRINPEELPTGNLMLIPSFEYLRFYHRGAKAYNATANLRQGDSISIYTLNYPELQRELRLFFQSDFPYEIEKWEEVNAQNTTDTSHLKTTAIKSKRLQSAYWKENKNEFLHLRDSLGLKTY